MDAAFKTFIFDEINRELFEQRASLRDYIEQLPCPADPVAEIERMTEAVLGLVRTDAALLLSAVGTTLNNNSCRHVC
ncbi:unnamed protein product [Symbiodinium natans]|uniref:Uncharacterized protein n=1 Tax=Symbiodinium natans TaxID=878477 RepID=A0A812R2A3_9DINO|nr:unnamed protein product [Symbiodinium natans]CAE7456587.1 unnamed protein product [Symbiodinium natans]